VSTDHSTPSTIKTMKQQLYALDKKDGKRSQKVLSSSFSLPEIHPLIADTCNVQGDNNTESQVVASKSVKKNGTTVLNPEDTKAFGGNSLPSYMGTTSAFRARLNGSIDASIATNESL
jgi:hypothetical protein